MASVKSNLSNLSPKYYEDVLQQHLYVKNLGSKCKNEKKSVRWYCHACSVMLTSRVQAKEHFFGKRHQNVLKSKDPLGQDSRHKIGGQNGADKRRLVVFDGFHSPSKSSFDPCLGSGNEISDSDDVVPPPAERDNILETVVKSEKKTFYSSDLSIFRTPSGKYYCQRCNVTVNSESQFLQHSKSKKHKLKATRTFVKGK